MANTEKRVLILGAAGRDFHNFLVACRDDERCRVVAFTATQIPDISGRRFPAALAGPRYPEGIPIEDEIRMEQIITEQKIDEVVFGYSDVPYDHVMHLASRAMAAGASFRLMGPNETMLRAKVPVVSICAVRTGCGKSQTSRFVVRLLRERGHRVVAIRHPMPYGDLQAQAVQRFAALSDLDKHHCTIEEREEYEPHIESGAVIYAGVDYAGILEQAQKEADVIVWDGGNNDFSFYHSDFEVAIVDPLRPGHELSFHPGETVLRRANAVVINKIKQAHARDIEIIEKNIAAVNPKATIIRAASPIRVPDPSMVRGKRAIVVEDGPTLTHGGMAIGAGWVIAKELGVQVVSPREYAVGSIRQTYEKYGQTKDVLPAMGYSEHQLNDLTQTIEQTIRQANVDIVLSATPIDLGKVIRVSVPIVHASYDLEELSKPGLGELLAGINL